MPSLPQAKSFAFIRCYLCDTLTETNSSVCGHCLQNIKTSPFNLGWQDILLRADATKMLDVRFVSQLFCLAQYQEPFSFLIPQMKYQADMLAKGCLRQILRSQPAYLSKFNFDYILPIPLHWFKYWLRGFNQASFIADCINEHLDIAVYTDIKRAKYTRQQAQLSGKQRRVNLKNVFKFAKSPNIHGKHILLVDDVVTTGTTLDSLAQFLIKNGAYKVSAICLTWSKLD